MRDEMASKGRLLAECRDPEGKPTAGLRMDVPDFLGRDYKLLTDYGFRMWRAHGEGTKRYVKYDEDCYGLVLELKLPAAQSYLRITPDMARSFNEEGDIAEINRVRRDLTARPPPTSNEPDSHHDSGPITQSSTAAEVNGSRGESSLLVRYLSLIHI